MQKINTKFAFANNVSKQFMELFHQMSIFVSYESLCRSLQANAKAVIEAILEKTQTRWFFISYDNMNFYKNIHDQRIFNRNGLINYTIRYIYFMKTSNSIENLGNSWENQYIDCSQIDRGLVNQLRYKDLLLPKRTLIIDWLWYDITFLEYFNSILPLLWRNKKTIATF